MLINLVLILISFEKSVAYWPHFYLRRWLGKKFREIDTISSLHPTGPTPSIYSVLIGCQRINDITLIYLKYDIKTSYVVYVLCRERVHRE